MKDVEEQSAGGESKPVGVVLCSYGEPARNSLFEHWLYSYRILKHLTRQVAKIHWWALPFIALLRAWRRYRLWDKHGFVSSLEPLTQETAEAVQTELKRGNEGRKLYLVSPAYEFRRPMLAKVLSQLRERGCERFILVPMYVGEGDFTVGMTRLAAKDALRKLPWLKPEHLAWSLFSGTVETRDRLAEVMAEHVIRCVGERGIQLPASDWALLLAAHGTFHPAPAGMDNGLLSICEVGWRLAKRLRKDFGTVRFGWLNHKRGGRWTEPSLARALARLRKDGYWNLIYFPWGFTTDNAETALEGKARHPPIQFLR